jgi:hypothetical protein
MPATETSVPDWTSSDLAIVACSCSQRDPPPAARLVELFQLRRRRLAAVRETPSTGRRSASASYPTGGFALELGATSRSTRPRRGLPAGPALLVLTLALLVLGWLYDSHSFRATARASPGQLDLENDRELARELGELLEVAAHLRTRSRRSRLRARCAAGPVGAARAAEEAHDPFSSARGRLERGPRGKSTPKKNHPIREARKVERLILLPVRNAAIFPGVVLPFGIGRERSLRGMQEPGGSRSRSVSGCSAIRSRRTPAGRPARDRHAGQVLRFVSTESGHHAVCRAASASGSSGRQDRALLLATVQRIEELVEAGAELQARRGAQAAGARGPGADARRA